jgi:hypothetical protein
LSQTPLIGTLPRNFWRRTGPQETGAGAAGTGQSCERRRQRGRGVLRQRPSGRWAIERPAHEPREFASGNMLRLWVGGRFVTVRMEYSQKRPTGFYTVPRHELREGGRVALFQPGDPN